MRKVCFAVLAAGLFLLLLSALVVTPEPMAAPSVMDFSADFHAVFRPLVSILLPETSDIPSSASGLRLFHCLMPVLLLCSSLLTGVRDANGRILTAVRYENSVYQLFRPEVAGG